MDAKDSRPTDPTLTEVSAFDWTDFQERQPQHPAVRGCLADGLDQPVFPHVEAATDSGVKAGMIVEMPWTAEQEQPAKFWLARIDAVYGPLLQLSYVGGPGDDRGAKKQVLHDLSSRPLYPLGYCQMNRIDLEPPEDIRRSCPTWPALALQYLEDVRYDTISQDHIDDDGGCGGGVTPVDRLRRGMTLLVRDRQQPDHFWPGVLAQNRGGWLNVKMRLPGEPGVAWQEQLFYASERLHPYEAELKAGQGLFRPPEPLRRRSARPDWDAAELQRELDLAAASAAPRDVLCHFVREPHSFRARTLVEAISPDRRSFELGMLESISDKLFVRLGLLSDPEIKLLCHRHSPDVFPVLEKEDDEDHLTTTYRSGVAEALKSLSSKDKKLAPASSFGPKVSAEKLGFKTNQKLDVFVDGAFRTATVVRLLDSVLLVELDTDLAEKTRLLFPAKSLEIFPLGWSLDNNIPCLLPKSLLDGQELAKRDGGGAETKAEERAERTPKEENGKKPGETDYSDTWTCPPVCFNYRCYSAFFLSKDRLSVLPKSVGPGSVQLVIGEVLSKLIGSSHKSGCVLKRLECPEPGRPRQGFVLEQFKGKAKVRVKADVEVPTRTDQVRDYLREVCRKLGACPYLVSTRRYDDECPANCRGQPTSEFHVEEQSGIAYRKRGGRKRRFRGGAASSKAGGQEHGGADRADGDEEEEEDDEDGDGDSRSSTPVSSTGTEATDSAANSRCVSPQEGAADNGQQQQEQPQTRRRGVRKEWENILPRSEIRTRGAKLPDFKLHLKIRPTKKEQSVIENTSLWASFRRTESTTNQTGSDAAAANGGGVSAPKRAKANGQSELAVGKRAMGPTKIPAAFKFSDIQAAAPLLTAPVPVLSPPHTQAPTLPRARTPPLAHNVPPPAQARARIRNRRDDNGPPPIREIHLDSNPEFWSSRQVADFLGRTADCAHLAQFMAQDEVDGKAFMMLNYATVIEYWSLQWQSAVRLCRHIESVRLAHHNQFVVGRLGASLGHAANAWHA